MATAKRKRVADEPSDGTTRTQSNKRLLRGTLTSTVDIATLENDLRPGRRRPIVPGRTQDEISQVILSTPSDLAPAAIRNQDTTPRSTAQSTAKRGESAERSIDKVVLGNLCFSTWYASPYGKEVLGEVSTSSGKVKGSKLNHIPEGDSKAQLKGTKGGGNASSSRGHEPSPMLERLHVCPCCFKYSKELVAWWAHVRYCQRRSHVPGEKIYIHPKGRSKRIAHQPPPLGSGRRSSIKRVVEEEVQNEGEWSIWEVDGQKDQLFCQNLSLFGKLFLDTKSVFYDVSAFRYYLLVYTTPHEQSTPIKQRIVGFFSKEKISWDNNNLACILVFPPWQKKGLGSLLMGVSYEISRREGIIGGPEQPLSELGRKGYKRYWAGEIARWIESLKATGRDSEVIVDVDECSRATWIAPDHCLEVLREMNVMEDGGMGLPNPKPGNGGEGDADEVDGVIGEAVRRVHLDKEQVRRWVKQNRISLDRVCDPDGFVAKTSVETEGEDEDEGSQAP